MVDVIDNMQQEETSARYKETLKKYKTMKILDNIIYIHLKP